MGKKRRVAIWAPRTPENFLIHMCRGVHFIKKIGLLMKIKEQVKVTEAAKLNCVNAKDVYSKSKKENNAKNDDNCSWLLQQPR